MARWFVTSLLVGDLVLPANAVLELSVNYRGFKAWGVAGELENLTVPPERGDAVIEAGGRRFAGHVLRRRFGVSSTGGAGSATFEYLGTGPLLGATDEDFGL